MQHEIDSVKLIDGIISEEDFYLTQSILNLIGVSNKKRVRENPDFPLRNTIICPHCNKVIRVTMTKYILPLELIAVIKQLGINIKTFRR